MYKIWNGLKIWLLYDVIMCIKLVWGVYFFFKIIIEPNFQKTKYFKIKPFWACLFSILIIAQIWVWKYFNRVNRTSGWGFGNYCNRVYAMVIWQNPLYIYHPYFKVFWFFNKYQCKFFGGSLIEPLFYFYFYITLIWISNYQNIYIYQLLTPKHKKLD